MNKAIMKFLAAPLVICATLSQALTLPTSPLSTRDIDVKETTNKLMFYTTLDDFERAQRAAEPKELKWGTFGCLGSVFPVGREDFTRCCWRKDFGYNNFKEQQRFTDNARNCVLKQFELDMAGECEKKGTLAKLACKIVGGLYMEAAVLLEGKGAGECKPEPDLLVPRKEEVQLLPE